MRAFVFRAQAALDLRQRKDEDARRELASANAAVAGAELALGETQAKLSGALASAREAETLADGAVTREWYRNWIIGIQREIVRRQDEVNQRRAVADTARERAIRTRVDVRVLEKLKERARRLYDTAVEREEQKAIDWLAVLRSHAGHTRQEDRE